ncbi:MAG: L-2-amino-thiazoline-4-carboxylic acid hydrolase [Candidatus Heimdallarchaeota archaeon]
MNKDIDNNNKSYYENNKEKIMKHFNSLIKVAEKVALSNYPDLDVHQIEEKARDELDSILSRLPYVGGDKSPFTQLLIQSAETIALYKASKILNLSEREIWKMIYEVAESSAQSLSSVKKWLHRRSFFSKKMKNYWREWMKESQKLKYSGNWVGEFIEGDNENFDYGINFTECGWLKLIQKEGTKEIAPYACLSDYARMQTYGIGFRRTKTMAAGAEMCNFRFIRNYQTQRGWPPENLEEFKTSQAKDIFKKE